MSETRPLVPHHTTGRPGPALAKLRRRQQLFVYWICELGGNVRKNTEAARRAGYTGGEDTMKATAYRLMNDTDVLAAIKEEAEKRLHSGLLLGTSVLLEIANDSFHKDRLKAALAIMDRAGMHAKSEHTVNVNDARTDKEVIDRIGMLAARLGLDPQKLLGRPVVDAEFLAVQDLPHAPDPVADLKDLL